MSGQKKKKVASQPKSIQATLKKPSAKPSKTKTSSNQKASKTPKKTLKKAGNDLISVKDGVHHVKAKIALEKDASSPDKDTRYLPRYRDENSACVELVARVTPSIVGGVPMPPKMLLNHRASAKIKTGVKIDVPKGFKLCVSALDELAEKGLVVSNSPAQVNQGCKDEVCVNVLNAGRELVEIKDGDKIANCWLEPVYRFDWELVQQLD